jgi:hypothetical protein
MIGKSIVIHRRIALAFARWPAMSGFVRNTAGTVSDFASIVHNLVLDIRDSYQPELHYMRGPGPKWQAKRWPGQQVSAPLFSSSRSQSKRG